MLPLAAMISTIWWYADRWRKCSAPSVKGKRKEAYYRFFEDRLDPPDTPDVLARLERKGSPRMEKSSVLFTMKCKRCTVWSQFHFRRLIRHRCRPIYPHVAYQISQLGFCVTGIGLRRCFIGLSEFSYPTTVPIYANFRRWSGSTYLY